MHIITKTRATICGRVIAAGVVLDLPEAEVKAALADGSAVPWPEPVSEPEPKAEPQSGGGGGAGDGGAGGAGGKAD